MVDVDGARLLEDLRELGRIGLNAQGGIDRAAFSEADLAARSWLRGRVEASGLHWSVDGIGNVFIDLPWRKESSAAAVWSGSHLDAVPNGGRFDGTVGVLAAVETLRRVLETDTELARPIRAVVLADEEGSFTSLLGSSALVSGFSAGELLQLRSRDGQPLEAALAQIGSDLEAASEVRLVPDEVDAFVELHIEQGPHLEAAGRQIGVVTDIVGMGTGTVTFTGRADHAGSTPMASRRDALRAAAEFIAAIPGLVSGEAVATCGNIQVHPGSTNVVVAQAAVSLDFRDSDEDALLGLRTSLLDTARRIADQHRLALEIDLDAFHQPAELDATLRSAVGAAAERRGLTHMPVRSRAVHDSMNFARVVPTAMIFVPSRDGKSHCPEERTEDDDIVRGANVLADVLVATASRPKA